MAKRFYINDFVEDLNYKSIILYITEEVNITMLREKLKKDYCNKLYRLDFALDKEREDKRNFFYIANCDFQDLDYPIHEYIAGDVSGIYNVYRLYYDEAADKFYVSVDLPGI